MSGYLPSSRPSQSRNVPQISCTLAGLKWISNCFEKHFISGTSNKGLIIHCTVGVFRVFYQYAKEQTCICQLILLNFTLYTQVYKYMQIEPLCTLVTILLCFKKPHLVNILQSSTSYCTPSSTFTSHRRKFFHQWSTWCENLGKSLWYMYSTYSSHWLVSRLKTIGCLHSVIVPTPPLHVV